MNIQNRLSQASSPYLKQHAGNPVDWYEWGDEALSKARSENKPLIISVGYAACHWCHVMAHESFSDQEIARFMNAHFVCIKVDREERPDIDRIYMDAAQLLTGRGGWPLNAFSLPDGRPFYAATYFPPDRWMEALKQLSTLYENDYDRILESAVSLTEGIAAIPFAETVTEKLFTTDDYIEAYNNQINTIDFEWGGYAGAPKFILPTGLEFLLQYHYLMKDPKALDAVIITLDAIAKGGIYDQIGGGFSRYSTDRFWKVPHFEKMLYDNAQLITLYAHAFQITGNSLYAEIVEQTIAFAERELRHPEGGYYASIDADSEDEEGKFYVWTKAEIDQILSSDVAGIVNRFYGITEKGNWENGKNILHSTTDRAVFAAENGWSETEFNLFMKAAGKSLLEYRTRRIRPATDDKMLTSWNALMITAYVNAYKAIGQPEYLVEALRTARFLEKFMLSADGLLFRVFNDKKVSVEAFLDDYALLAEAFIHLYEVTFDFHWLQQSRLLITFVFDHFADSRNQLFFYTSDQSENLIVRKHEISDNVIPASNSVLAHVLYKLGILFDEKGYSQTAEKMVLRFREEILKQGVYFSNWGMLLGKRIGASYEVAILGDKGLLLAKDLQKKYLPHTLFAGGNSENLPLLKNRLINNRNLIYVCKDGSCYLPVETAEEGLKLIR